MDAGGAGSAPTQFYARRDVDVFVAAAAEQRAELEAAIAAANERAERAHAALSQHRMMAATLLETQHEIEGVRRAAELQAAEILRAADAEVRAIEGPPPEPGTPDASIERDDAVDLRSLDVRDVLQLVMSDQLALPSGASSASEPVIDLTARAHHPAASGSASEDAQLADLDDFDQFLAFLRDSSFDEEPLGPWPGEELRS